MVTDGSDASWVVRRTSCRQRVVGATTAAATCILASENTPWARTLGEGKTFDEHL